MENIAAKSAAKAKKVKDNFLSVGSTSTLKAVAFILVNRQSIKEVKQIFMTEY